MTTETEERKPLMQKTNQLKRPLHADIEVRAYEIWEKKGRPANQEVGCWFQAEQELLLLYAAPRPRSAIKATRSL